MERKRVERVVGSPVRTAVLLAALGTALLFAAGASGRVASKVFTDPAGDAGVGPDIRAISIGDSGGIVTFKLDAPGMKIPDGSGVKATFLFVDLDTNKDGKHDYALIVGNDAEGFSWDVTGPSGKSLPLSTWMSYFRTGDSYWIKVSSTDLGGATSFDLYARAGTIADDGSVAGSDDAPDGGAWSYQLTSVKPVIGRPTTSPLGPVAGKAFSITAPVTRSDSGVKVTIGTMISDLRVGTQTLVHTQSFKNGTAAVHLTVPTSAKGRVMTVRIAIESDGQLVTRLASFRVA
jgi:hypothetical protein